MQGSESPLHPDRPNGDDGEVEEGSAEETAEAVSAAAARLEAAKRAIRRYYESDRISDLELPSEFSRTARKELHLFADKYALKHRSVGPEGDRRIIIRRWQEIEVVLPSVGAGVVGALVAREVNARVVRGHVEGFDAATCEWRLLYTDGGSETVDVDVLNARLARRYQYDHGPNGLGEPGARPAGPPRVGNRDDAWLKELLNGINPDWAKGRLK